VHFAANRESLAFNREAFALPSGRFSHPAVTRNVALQVPMQGYQRGTQGICAGTLRVPAFKVPAAYKRSQVEDAISRDNAGGPARSKLLVRMKRLLDIAITRPADLAANSAQCARTVPQIDVVQILRTLRPELEKEHQQKLEKPTALLMYVNKAVREGEPVFSIRLPSSKLSLRNVALPLNCYSQAVTIVEFSLLAHAIRNHLKVVEPRRRGRTD